MKSHCLHLCYLSTSFSSIYFATNGEMTRAILCVWVGGFLDAVDGALARFLDACSPFGVTVFRMFTNISCVCSFEAEIDSLADLVSFGVSPALSNFPTFSSKSGQSQSWCVKCFFSKEIIDPCSRGWQQKGSQPITASKISDQSEYSGWS